jgi:signal recognition particle subunit SRP54
MLGQLTEKFRAAIDQLRGKGKIRPEDLQESARQIKLGLLEADVHYKVVQSFIKTVTERLVGLDQIPTLSITQHFIGILQEEMLKLLGEAPQLDYQRTLLVGLQGSGKTTSAAKLAKWMETQLKQFPLLVPADVQRPAAIEQLKSLGRKYNLKVFDTPIGVTAVEACRLALDKLGTQPLIVDTAGRLQIDPQLMQELAAIHNMVQPTATILVVDAMTGQQAVEVAQAFHQQTPLSGLIMSKIDGDARGGAALSIRALTGIPICFFGTGEQAEHLERFDPHRLTSRLLDMGDLGSLAEKLQGLHNNDALTAGSSPFGIDIPKPNDVDGLGNYRNFSLEDFLKAISWMKKLGPLEGLLRMMPGFSKVSKGLDLNNSEEALKRVSAIIQSMTKSERRDPSILNGSRRLRIANGSGTRVEEINRLIKQFEAMKKMMKSLGPKGFGGFKRA